MISALKKTSSLFALSIFRNNNIGNLTKKRRKKYSTLAEQVNKI
jgi:hypothetical protein